MQDPTSSWFLKLALMESFRGSLLNNINSIMAESSLCSNCGDIKVLILCIAVDLFGKKLQSVILLLFL